MIATSVDGHNRAGSTAERPTNMVAGMGYLDTDLGVMLFADTDGTLKDAFGQVPESSANGAVAGSGAAASERTSPVHKTIITLTARSVTMVDAGAAGCHGGTKIYDFPAGNISIIGATTDLAITAGAGGIVDGAAVVGSVGSVVVATDNATLTSTEANIVPSTVATLTAGVGACDGESTAGTTLDGTATAVDAYLNFAVPTADSSADDTIAVTGTVTIIWQNLGDN